MHRRAPFSSHSFRLILYLEWILLGITLLGEIRPTRHGISPTTLSLSNLTLMGFGLMGLKLPTGKTRDKLLYTGLEFGLLLLAFFLDSRPDFFPLVGLIIVIRSCLIFEQIGRLIVAGLVFIAFLLTLFLRSPFGRGATLSPGPRLPRHGPIPESIANTSAVFTAQC